MKTPFRIIAAVSASVLGGCACNQPEAVQVDAQPAMSSQAWRLNHDLTAERRAQNPQPEFDQPEPDDPAGGQRSRGMRRDVWVINDALLKLADDGSFESHFMLAEGGSFAVDGEWKEQSVAEGTLIELDPKPSTHYVPSPANPNSFVDSCVILIDESGRRMRFMGIGLPDLILTPVP
jgi:hypothetical protein